ncbi:glycosyltransferase [bacterium]|nr:glycosyltransferase [bacterium]
MIWLYATLLLPSLFWLIGVVRWLGAKRKGSQAEQTQSIAVVVVARNEERTISDCLISICEQCIGPQEVILMDDSSDDQSPEIVRNLAKKYGKLRMVTFTSKAGRSPKKTGLALAFANIDTELVALTDADCVVPNKWLESMAKYSDSKIGAVIGASWPSNDKGILSRIYRWERLIANVSMASACGWGSPASACGHNILYRREALNVVEAPVRRDLTSGDDDLTVQAIARAGFRVVFCPDSESVVHDLGGVRGSRWSQAVRHQSVTKLYPLHWQVVFLMSVVSGVVVPASLVALPAFGQILIPVSFAAAKILLDTFSGIFVKRKLKLDISNLEILLASLLLPFWMIWRALASIFGKSYSWRDRKIAATGR